MPRPRPDTPPRSLGWGLVLPATAILAMVSLALAQEDPATAAETGYLALAAGIVLLAAAAAAPHPSVESGLGSLLVAAAVWTLPAGPARGAVALGLATATLAVAAARWLPLRAPGGGEGRNGSAGGAAGSSGLPGPGRLPVLPVVALALGLQALLRGEALLAAGGGWVASLRVLVLFVGFPLVGAAAVLLLAPLHGRRRALLAAAAVLVAGPGFRPATLAALVALVAVPWGLAPLPSGPARHRLGTALALRSCALAAAILPFAWDARAGAAGALAGLAAATAGRGRWRAWLAPVLAAAAAGAAFTLPVHMLAGGSAEALAPAALVPLAVPALALPARRGAPLALAALLLGLAASRVVGVEGALAAPVGLAALALPRRGPVVAVQGAWSATLLALGAVVAAYPWLRPRPLPAVLEVLGLGAGWPAASAVVAGTALLAGGWALASRLRPAGGGGPPTPTAGASGGPERAPAATALATVGLLVVLGVPSGGTDPVGGAGRVLDAAGPVWTLEAADLGSTGPVGAVVLDSALSNAAGLPEGTPVATVRLQGRGGRTQVWTLRMGRESGEWAAGRSGVDGSAAPRPWSAWVPEEGTFFGRRYRAVRHLPAAVVPEALELARRSDLPPEVALTVFHLELRP